jgi:hypothetical protein
VRKPDVVIAMTQEEQLCGSAKALLVLEFADGDPSCAHELPSLLGWLNHQRGDLVTMWFLLNLELYCSVDKSPRHCTACGRYLHAPATLARG